MQHRLLAARPRPDYRLRNSKLSTSDRYGFEPFFGAIKVRATVTLNYPYSSHYYEGLLYATRPDLHTLFLLFTFFQFKALNLKNILVRSEGFEPTMEINIETTYYRMRYHIYCFE